MKFFNSHPSQKIISKLTKNLSVLVTLQSSSHSYDEPEMAITLVIPEKRNIEETEKFLCNHNIRTYIIVLTIFQQTNSRYSFSYGAFSRRRMGGLFIDCQ